MILNDPSLFLPPLMLSKLLKTNNRIYPDGYDLSVVMLRNLIGNQIKIEIFLDYAIIYFFCKNVL